MVYSIDFETRSIIDLPDRGLDIYSNDPSTEVLCIAFGTSPENVKVYSPKHNADYALHALFKHVQDGGKIAAWNVAFEYAIWNFVCVPKYGWPPLAVEQCIDTMAQAAACNTPQALEDCAIFFDSGYKKDTIGKKLIQKLCKPHNGKFNEDPELMRQLFDYCIQDVKAEMGLQGYLRPLSDAEQKVWELTMKINLRGVPVDVAEVQNAVKAVNSAQSAIDAQCLELTGCKPSERAKLLKWLNERGAGLEDLTAETVTNKLKAVNLNNTLKTVLELRQDGSQTSVAKYAKILDIQREGRIRNTLVYHGASTGRWSSRGGLNLQNIARPTISDEDIEKAIPRVFGASQGSMAELSSLVRAAISAPSGRTFVDVDFSSIENRVAAWIAGQTDKVEMFRQGMDEYKVFASEALYRIPYEEVTKDQRQISKSAVLGCFGSETKVLTKQGAKRIIDITPQDFLWDGVEWVRSEGSRFMGLKTVINMLGVQVTPDHKILTGAGWEPASTANLKSALAMANGPLSVMKNTAANSMAACDASVVTNMQFPLVTFALEKANSAKLVQFEALLSISWRNPGTMSCETKTTERVGLTEGLQQSQGAMTQKAQNTRTMVGGELLFAMSGEKALQPFFNSFKHCLGGMIPRLKWIGSKMMAIMPRVTFGWQQEKSKPATQVSVTGSTGAGSNGQLLNFGGSLPQNIEVPVPFSENLEKEKHQNKSSINKTTAVVPTYDVINCGPRNRFTIVTDSGHLIVHNCMFGQGAKGLVKYAAGMGVVLSEQQAKNAVDSYRSAYAKVKNLWAACETAAIQAIQTPGTTFSANQRIKLKVAKNALWMQLPSGRLICWQKPETEMLVTPWGASKLGVTVFSQNTYTREWKRNPLIGSSIFQSAVQGTARDALAEAMLNLDMAGYEVVNSIHDEVLLLVDEPMGEIELKNVEQIMVQPPAWAPGFPLAAEGWYGKRYRK